MQQEGRLKVERCTANGDQPSTLASRSTQHPQRPCQPDNHLEGESASELATGRMSRTAENLKQCVVFILKKLASYAFLLVELDHGSLPVHHSDSSNFIYLYHFTLS